MARPVLSLSVDAREVLARLHGFPPKLNASIVRELRGELLVLQTSVRRNARIKSRRGAAGLFGRLTSYADLTATGIRSAIGFRKTGGFPYELTHEFGANAGRGAMPVPISPDAKGLAHRNMGPRSMTAKLFVLRTNGKAFLAEYVQGKRMPVFHYILMKSLPPRLNFRQTVLAAGPQISSAIVNGANRGIAHA